MTKTESSVEDCPTCGGSMMVFRNGFYEEAECEACGYTETQQLVRPL